MTPCSWINEVLQECDVLFFRVGEHANITLINVKLSNYEVCIIVAQVVEIAVYSILLMISQVTVRVSRPSVCVWWGVFMVTHFHFTIGMKGSTTDVAIGSRLEFGFFFRSQPRLNLALTKQ